MKTIGLSFELKLPSDGAKDRFTTAKIAVRCDNEVIWPVAGADAVFLEIQIDDLLSHLVECWQPLTLRQTFPVATKTERPSQLRAEAEQRWEEQPAEVAEREDELILNFEEVHDLSNCFAGYFDLAPLWLMRRGDKMVVDTRAGMRVVDFSAAWKEITRVGDAIAGHLAAGGERWSRLLANWKVRDKADPTSLLMWSTSLSRSVTEIFVREGVLSAPQSLSEAANDNDELRIAARMASALPPDQVRQILEIVRSFDKTPAPELDALSAECSAYIAEIFSTRRAHEQGEAAARFVRDRLGMLPTDRFEIVDFMNHLQIAVSARYVEPRSLRALAVWGSRYGPAVLINLRANRGSLESADSRVNLAHELCHQLLDRGHALGAVEILNSRMPLDIERRAKAFAGELLLPSARAAEEWREARSPKSQSELWALIHSLRIAYGVTKSVASWKLEHGAKDIGTDLSVLLDSIVPGR